MYIVAIAWIYVVLMMSITEETVVAGVMTFALYGILPLTIVLYIMNTGSRRRARAATVEAVLAAGGPRGTVLNAASGETLPPCGQEPSHGPLPESPSSGLHRNGTA